MVQKDSKSNKTKENVKLLKPKNDIVFQNLFTKNNVGITKAFAEALLEEKIDKISINEDKELLRENPNDKLGILDLEIDVNNNEKVDVEIQLVDKKNFVQRLLFYFSKLYQSQIKKGSNYMDAKRVVLIAIIDYPFDLTESIEEMETIWQIMEKTHRNLVLTNYFELHILELEKVRNTYLKDKNNEKAQWMLFLDDPNSMEVQEIMEDNKEIKEATVVVRKMSEDEKMQRLANLREKAIMDEKAIYEAGIDKGIKQGIEQGIEQRDTEIVKNMLSANMPIEQISKLTGIDIEKIKSIAKTI